MNFHASKQTLDLDSRLDKSNKLIVAWREEEEEEEFLNNGGATYRINEAELSVEKFKARPCRSDYYNGLVDDINNRCSRYRASVYNKLPYRACETRRIFYVYNFICTAPFFVTDSWEG